MTLRWLCWLSVCLAWFWVLMLLSHELGHVLLARLTGGVVTEGNLWPGALAYTLIAPNPSPHWVAWGGVIVGCAAPVLLWFALKISGRDVAVLRGLAGFCLLSNGAYLAAGGSESLTDTGVLRTLGWPLWLLVIVGMALAVPGYRWCRQFLLEQRRSLADGKPSWRTIGWLALAWCVWVIMQALLVTHYDIAS